jgi:hypothetical protein
MHRGGPGYDKIERCKYVVSDEDSYGALIPQDKWLDSFQPGRRIALSFQLKHPDQAMKSNGLDARRQKRDPTIT